MSEADKLFEELGYENVRENKHWIVYKGQILSGEVDFNENLFNQELVKNMLEKIIEKLYECGKGK